MRGGQEGLSRVGERSGEGLAHRKVRHPSWRVIPCRTVRMGRGKYYAGSEGMEPAVAHSPSTFSLPKSTYLVLLLALAIQVAFIHKPLHVDDTVVVHIARQILRNPIDPFGGEMDWDGSVRNTFHVTTNPPMLSYLLAPVIAVGGERAWLMHAVMLIWQPLLWWGTVLLARRFGVHPTPAAALALLNPATVVSPNLMRDVPMVALWTLGTAWFVLGSDSAQGRRMVLGALVAGCAVLMKYSGLGAVVLLAVYVLLQRRPGQLWYVLWGLLPLALWCAHNLLVYGQLHLVATLLRKDIVTPLSDRLWGTLAGLGGVWLLWLWAMVMCRHAVVMGIGVMAGLVVGWWRWRLALPAGDVESAFWCAVGAVLLVLSIVQAVRLWRKQAFCVVWTAWVLLAIGVGAPFAAARHLLPALPPLALLWGDAGNMDRWRSSALSLILLVQAVYGVYAGCCDMQIADVYRRAAPELAERHSVQAFVGHWGWMYYAQRAGLKQVSANRLPEPCTRIAVPTVGGDAAVPPSLVPSLMYEESVEITAPARLATLPPRAGFYASLRGAPPFRWLPDGYREQFDLFTVEDGKR